MGLFNSARRRELSKQAAELYRSGSATWGKGKWIRDPRTRETVGPNNTMGSIRDWLRDHKLFARNKCSTVCAEGALLLTFAFDPSVPDDVTGSDLLKEFRSEARKVLQQNGMLGGRQYDGIPDWNDTLANASSVLDLFDGLSELPVED